MSKSVEEILDDALKLSNEDREVLLVRLESYVDDDTRGEPSEAWMEIARRRADDLHSGNVVGIPVEEALARVHRNLAQWK